LAKIAVDLAGALAERAVYGAPGSLIARVLTSGNGWAVEDVVCTSGPRDRPFEEQHSQFRVAIVVAGSFQYRSNAGCELMTAGSILLGNADQHFMCGHDHGEGDRCLSFGYRPDFFERLATDAGGKGARDFRALRLPPLRAMSPLVARACAGITAANREPNRTSWEELAIQLAARAVQLAAGSRAASCAAPANAQARVTRALRMIERYPDARLGLSQLAGKAGLSPYHFLRTFERVTGVTPHQYVRRIRLREAARRLELEPTTVLDLALDCGFGDLSAFNRAFRAEFGVSPRVYRRASCGGSGSSRTLRLSSNRSGSSRTLRLSSSRTLRTP
jgi:AraC-like DNA-binding protein